MESSLDHGRCRRTSYNPNSNQLDLSLEIQLIPLKRISHGQEGGWKGSSMLLIPVVLKLASLLNERYGKTPTALQITHHTPARRQTSSHSFKGFLGTNTLAAEKVGNDLAMLHPKKRTHVSPGNAGPT